ncbi:MFS transporter [Erwinia sp.]|uniref:MFS transporter n=1 Tax=Erwinia citreus TaxID=558 RepID=UPI003C76A9BA
MKRTLSAMTLFALLVLLVGLNLRPLMAAIGPLLPLLQRQEQLSGTTISLLTTLPVMMMGLMALASGTLLRRIGYSRGITFGLGIITLACFLRGFYTSSGLLMATALAGGVGIGLVQAAMPALIKRRYATSAGTLMALFSTGIMGGAALAAATAEPISASLGLNYALGLAAFPAALAFIIWFAADKNPQKTATKSFQASCSTSRAWLLLAFFGIGTGAYTLVLAWLPPFYIQQGWSARNSGYLLAALTITEVLSGFIVSAVIHRFTDRRGPLLIVLLMILAGLLCLVMFGGTAAILSTLLLGMGIGALFPLSLIVTFDHARTPEEAGKLLSFVQGGGYLIAATLPLIAGLVRDKSASLTAAWLIMSVGIILLLILSRRFRPAL